MKEHSVLDRNIEATTAQHEAHTTFENRLRGYAQERVGSAEVFTCLKDVVKTAGVYGSDISTVLAENAEHIREVAGEKKDIIVAQEARALIGLASAMSPQTDGHEISYEEKERRCNVVIEKYGSMQAGSDAVVRGLTETLAGGIQKGERSSDVLDTAHKKAQEKGDFMLARQCNVLRSFTSLLVKKQ